MFSLFTDNFVIYRATSGAYSGGFYQEQTRSAINATGSIQPDNGNKENIIDNPGNQATDTSGKIKIFSEVELFTKENSPLNQADIILYNNKYYMVQESANWQKLGLSHYKSRAVLHKGKLNIV